MISVYLNNQPYDIAFNLSLQDFLLDHQPSTSPFAVAINRQFVPRSLYNSTILCEGDRVDLIVPMQGG